VTTPKIEKKYRKVKEVENNRKSLNKEIIESPIWSRTKKLIEKDCQLYDLWYKRTNDLGYLLRL
jgi:hypothetical protein